MNTTQNSPKSKIVKVIGVDLAKDHCDVIGYDENGKICLRLDGCSYATCKSSKDHSKPRNEVDTSLKSPV